MHFLKLGVGALFFSLAVHFALFAGLWSKAMFMKKPLPGFQPIDLWSLGAIAVFFFAGVFAYQWHQKGGHKKVAKIFKFKRPRASQPAHRRKLAKRKAA